MEHAIQCAEGNIQILRMINSFITGVIIEEDCLLTVEVVGERGNERKEYCRKWKWKTYLNRKYSYVIYLNHLKIKHTMVY